MNINQNGIIFTNSKCIGCNKCILECPLPGANISGTENGENRIFVDGDKCVHCGTCLKTCTHGAREYIDDTEAFLSALENGDKLSILIDPSFALDYPQKAGQIVNYLVSLGVEKVYDVGIGAEISVYESLCYIDAHKTGGHVTANCPVIVNYLERYTPGMTKHLIPVQPPEVCMAIYARKYLHDKNSMAYIGPCTARRDDFDSEELRAIIGYNVTFNHLFAALSDVNLDDYPEESYYTDDGLGGLCSLSGGMQNMFENFIGEEKAVVTVESAISQIGSKPYFMGDIFKDNAPFITDMHQCSHGCAMGPAIDSNEVNLFSILEGGINRKSQAGRKKGSPYDSSLTIEERRQVLNNKYKALDHKDFERKFADRFKQERTVPDSVINEVFNYMHKDDESKRRIDCHSCGYGSCTEMAKAIALGYNRRDNCVHFEKDENRRLSMTDTHTGLPNINAFNIFVNELIKQGTSGEYAAISFALLEWELINERYGYDEGSKVMREFAQKAETFVLEDEILARMGGVEFLAVVRGSRLDAFLQNIRGIIIHPNDSITQTEVDFRVSISAGYYRISWNDESVGDIYAKVTIAAKQARANDTAVCIEYDDKMKEQIINSMVLTKAFPTAMRNKEYMVYYQPKVELETMELEGAEALVRWKHDGEMISPGAFIPLYEKNGYVVHIDFYVLEQVCRDLRSWIDAGVKPVRISTNFSKLHIKESDLVDRITEVADRYEIPHELISIEFTETAYEEERNKLSEVLIELKARGFSSSIDDFGSGYSSLNMLQTLDFQVLKLDKAFLDSGISDAKTRYIISSVIDMAKRLEMKVVAEGVEKREEVDFLKGLSCDTIQGFYFDKPMPSDKFLERLISPVYIRDDGE